MGNGTGRQAYGSREMRKIQCFDGIYWRGGLATEVGQELPIDPHLRRSMVLVQKRIFRFNSKQVDDSKSVGTLWEREDDVLNRYGPWESHLQTCLCKSGQIQGGAFLKGQRLADQEEIQTEAARCTSLRRYAKAREWKIRMPGLLSA